MVVSAEALENDSIQVGSDVVEDCKAAIGDEDRIWKCSTDGVDDGNPAVADLWKEILAIQCVQKETLKAPSTKKALSPSER